MLLVLGVGLGLATGSWEASAVTALYVALSTAYTFWLKHVAVVDIAMITSFFVIRAVAGVVGTDIPLSDWYLIVASFGALFIVAGKRTVELRLEDAVDHRAALAGVHAGLPALRALGGLRRAPCSPTACGRSRRPTWPTRASRGSSCRSCPSCSSSCATRSSSRPRTRRGPEEIVLEDRLLQVLGLLWAATFAAASTSATLRRWST